MEPVISPTHLLAHSPASHSAGHGVQSSKQTINDPALTKLPVCWGHTSYKHLEHGNRGGMGFWPRHEGWGPSESDLLFPLLPLPPVPLETAMAVSPRGCLCY